MSKAAFNSAPKVVLPDGRGPLIVEGDGIEVEFRDGKIHVRSGEIATTPATNNLSTTASTAALKVGDVVQEGPNKGWIYCETRQREAFLVAPKDSGVMQWRAAMTYASREKAELPCQVQLEAMYEARNTGALNGTFNITGSLPAGGYWSTTQDTTSHVWCQRFSDGNKKYYDYRFNMASVRCVRRHSIT